VTQEISEHEFAVMAGMTDRVTLEFGINHPVVEWALDRDPMTATMYGPHRGTVKVHFNGRPEWYVMHGLVSLVEILWDLDQYDYVLLSADYLRTVGDIHVFRVVFARYS